MPPDDYRQYLKNEFDRRLARNAKYSLRAFSRDLAISLSNLSKVLNRQGGLSARAAGGLADRLHLSPGEKEYFVLLVNAEHARSRVARERAKREASAMRAKDSYREVDLERFAIVAGWQHFAILELVNLREFRGDARWIGRRLGIDAKVADESFRRLLQQGYLQEVAGRWERTQVHVAAGGAVPSRIVAQYHEQMLARATEALQRVPFDQREFSCTNIAIDPAHLPEAREELKKFRRRFAVKIQADGEKKRVYTLGIQLFPLDQMEAAK